jgi:alkaline phosphatase
VSQLIKSPKKNVILLISDGFGPASETLARHYYTAIHNLSYHHTLPLDLILKGTSRTRSHSSLITDSAAGATAFSCKLKTYNGAIAVDHTKSPCATVLEAAKIRGYSTGLVATSRITHATPASFAAHVIDRNMENLIAQHQLGEYPLGRSVDLMFGGGYCHFLPNTTANSCRQDKLDLLDSARKNGWTFEYGKEYFDTLIPHAAKLPIINLFAHDHMSYELDRDDTTQPSLSQMAEKAIQILSKKSSKGFFLMIEGSRIDMAAHANDPAAHVHDIMEYQNVINTVKNFVDSRDDTVMISVADHETGGISVGYQVNEAYPEYIWFPEVLSKVKNSTEVISRYIIENKLSLDQDFIRDIVLKDWLGIEDPADSEVFSYLNKTQQEYEYSLGKVVSHRAQIGFSTHGHSGVDVNLVSFLLQLC